MEKKGLIFDIQGYSIHDGPGIRTSVYFKGCPLRCYWCHNPESQAGRPEIAFWTERCVACGKCAENCPTGALELRDRKIFRDLTICRACGLCERICPNQAQELIGRQMTVNQIMEKIELDRPFYERSGGGVTITGGEPTMQPEFLIELLDAIRKSGLHSALDTCGYFGAELGERLIDKVDLFLFDLKHVSGDKLKEAVGAPCRRTLANFRRIVEAGRARIVPRLPLIPEFNADGQSIAAVIGFLGDAGYRGEVHLMPPHNYARGKYERLDRAGDWKDPGRLSATELADIAERFRAAGFEPKIQA